MRVFFKNIFLNTIISSYLIPSRLRNYLYSLVGYRIEGVICPGCFCGYGKGVLSIGRGSSVNYKCFFDLSADVTIGCNCNVSYQVCFVNSSHIVGNELRRGGNSVANPIIIEDGCWIGANVTIMPGVTIHKGCVIGTGTIVTKDCEPNGLYIGIPARRVKNL